MERLSDADWARNLSEFVLDCYRTRRFCDVKIFVDSDSSEVIHCHSLVLSSVSPWLRRYLFSLSHSSPKCVQDCSPIEICLSDWQLFGDLRRFLDGVYDRGKWHADDKKARKLKLSPDLIHVLGLDQMLETFEKLAEVCSVRGMCI